MHVLSLRSHEYRELTGNFDGYALYNKMSWTRVSGAKLESRGIFTEIPFRGYSGWLCNYNDANTPKYACVSRFVDSSDFNELFPPDLTVERPADRPDLYGVSYDEGTWVCDVQSSGLEDTATCT